MTGDEMIREAEKYFREHAVIQPDQEKESDYKLNIYRIDGSKLKIYGIILETADNEFLLQVIHPNDEIEWIPCTLTGDTLSVNGTPIPFGNKDPDRAPICQGSKHPGNPMWNKSKYIDFPRYGKIDTETWTIV